MMSSTVEDALYVRFSCLTPWYSVILKKLIIPQLEMSTFLWNRMFTPCLQDPATGPYTEPEKFRPLCHTIFLYDPV
jgi:hypothetical protein